MSCESQLQCPEGGVNFTLSFQDLTDLARELVPAML